LGARQVEEQIEGDNRVKRLGLEVHPRYVRVDEGRLGNALAGERDLRLGDLDPGQTPPFGQDARRVDPGARAELKHVRRRRQQGEEIGEVAQPGRARYLRLPLVEPSGDRVVAFGHKTLGIVHRQILAVGGSQVKDRCARLCPGRAR